MKKPFYIRKKLFLAAAVLIALSLLISGAYAYIDESQGVISPKHGGAFSFAVLHDDFEAGVQKDVYVENIGETYLLVRVKFTEYLQIGNNPVVGDNPGKPKTWELHKFLEKAHVGSGIPGEFDGDCENYPIHNKSNWIMNGAAKIYRPGMSSNGLFSYVEGQKFPEGTVAKSTLPANDIITIAEYIANSEKYINEVNGRWVLGTDGYAFWSKPLAPKTATNLLLHNVYPPQNLSDNFYYAVDVILEFSNADTDTET